MKKTWIVVAFAAAVAGAGCGESTKNKMIDIVPIATARDVYFTASGMAGVTATPTDPTCPVATTMGTTIMVEGGCTDSDGDAWSGSAVFDGDINGDWTVTWNAFTVVDAPSECNGDPADDRGSTVVDGSASLSGTAGTVASFTLNVTETDVQPNLLGCGEHTIEKTYDYSGTVETGADTDGDGTPDELTFDGAGTISRAEKADDLTITATTVAQFMDRTICDREPLSGTTTMVSGNHSGVVTNDGATDCDDPPTGAFTYDGEAQDEVAIGSVCTVVRVGGRGAPAGLALVAAVLVAGIAFRRRAPGRRTARPEGR